MRRVNPDVLRRLLTEYPDQQEANYVIDGFTHGFKLGLDRHPLPREPCQNSAKAMEKHDKTAERIAEEVELGHILGPFDEPPLEGMVYSPINVVDKAGDPDKVRLIHNLAWPYNDQSVNKCIPRSEAAVKYHYIDEIIQVAIHLGGDIWGCRVDFRHGRFF